MRLSMKPTVLLLLFAAACSSGDDEPEASPTTRPKPTTTTTTAAPECDPGFEIPLESEESDECLSYYLREVAAQEDIPLTDDAETQAVAFCRDIRISGYVAAAASAFLAWDEGSRPPPSSDVPAFAAIAVGIYCPEHYDDLRSTG